MSNYTERLDLITNGNTELKNELINMFLSCADKVLAKLKQHSDAQNIKNSAHELKGAADNLGFTDISNICKKIESEGEVLPHISSLEQAIETLKKAL